MRSSDLGRKRSRNDERRSDGSGKEDFYAKQCETILNAPPLPVLHFPSTLPFPQYLSEDFPSEKYRSRRFEIKTSVHCGQRKLLLSEIQLLSKYCKPDVSYHIVYAGSAPGTHLGFLDDMFNCRHSWELIDPGQFDRAVLGSRANFSLRNEFFTNATAYGIRARRIKEHFPALGSLYDCVTSPAEENVSKKELHLQLESKVGTLDVARLTEDIPSMYETPLSLPKGFQLLCDVCEERNKPLLFVSDIRSGSLELSNFEEHVAENMKAQECWTQLLNGVFSMLKFRLPYTSILPSGHSTGKPSGRPASLREDGTVLYLKGEILLPIWTRPTSTEGRLVVRQDALPILYNVEKVEDQFFYFNSRVREQFHFNHPITNNSEWLDHHYDASAEVHCLTEYLVFTRPELKKATADTIADEVKKVSQRITDAIGVTFEDAVRRRDALVVKQAAQNKGRNPQKVNGRKTLVDVTKALIERGTVERSRDIWKKNLDESKDYEAPKEWV